MSPATAMMSEADAETFPPLRQDLRLHPSGADKDGAPSWAIQDPVNNTFFRIGWLEYECLLRWTGQPESMAAEIEAHTPLTVDAEQVAAFGRFLEHHQLLLPTAKTRQRMQQAANEPGWRHWRWWLHHYLFIRVPIIRPQRFLAWLSPRVSWLFTPWAFALFAFATLLGLFLTARQWETFTHSIMDSLTPSGFVGFMLALVVSKTLHELGHAVVATRLGVRVAHMGVALLVMWPMLYTDTGESWRLRSHRQRLAISAAGIMVELGLAGLATLAWALLDDGSLLLRQSALYLATTGWVMSLALNLSPFMRFDGYFILSDLIDFPNLHERSGALARTWLRRHLLGLPDAWPEALPSAQRRMLIAFALSTWLYRFVVFLGIAWMVYAFFFKALGIFLMMVEVVWFIARPAWMELAVWKKRWAEVKMSRRWKLYGLLALLLCLLLMPWRFSVNTYGVLYAERQQRVFAPFPAMLSELHPAGHVTAGTILARWVTPDLDARQKQAEAGAEAIEHQLSGLLAKREGIDQQMALTQKLDERQTEVRGAREEQERLAIRAEFDGQWRDVSGQLRPGVWLGVREPLGVLMDPTSWRVDAYVDQHQIDRISIGAQAHFLPQGSVTALSGEVVDIDTTRTQRLPYEMLASHYGGAFTTHANASSANSRAGGREAIPVEALYRVRIKLKSEDRLERMQEMRGQVRIEGRPRSLLWDGAKGTIATLIRESGF